jgi:hypothetical protein
LRHRQAFLAFESFQVHISALPWVRALSNPIRSHPPMDRTAMSRCACVKMARITAVSKHVVASVIRVPFLSPETIFQALRLQRTGQPLCRQLL